MWIADQSNCAALSSEPPPALRKVEQNDFVVRPRCGFGQVFTLDRAIQTIFGGVVSWHGIALPTCLSGSGSAVVSLSRRCSEGGTGDTSYAHAYNLRASGVHVWTI